MQEKLSFFTSLGKLLKKEALLWGILLAAFLLRLPLLNGSFWLDEAAQALESARPLSQQLLIRDDFQPPLIHVWVHLLLQISREEAWLRFGAATLPALISLYFGYRIATRLFGKTTAIAVTAFLSLSSFQIFYAQELRPYALPLMFATVGWWFLLEKNWVAFTFCSIAGWYTSYLYPFLWVGQMLWAFRPPLKSVRQFWRAPALSAAASGLAFLPWLPFFSQQLQAGTALRQSFGGWEKIVGYGPLKAPLLVFGKFFFGVLDLEVAWPYILATVGIVVGLSCAMFCIRSVVWSKRTAIHDGLWLVLSWGILPIALAWLVSWGIPVLQPKRVLFSFPALAMGLFFILFLALRQVKKGSWRYFVISTTVVLIFILQVIGTSAYFTQSKYQREDWRGAHKWISARYKPENTAVFQVFSGPFAAWEWYNHPAFPTIATESYTIDSEEALIKIKSATEYENIIVFDYLRDLTDPKHHLEETLTTFGYVESNRLTPSTPLGIVHVFTKRIRLLTGTL